MSGAHPAAPAKRTPGRWPARCSWSAPVMNSTLPARVQLCGRVRSWLQQHLDRLALVHRAIALGGLIERELDVEDLARVDLPVPDEVDELGQEAAHRGGAAVHVREAPEQVHASERDAVRDADEADVSARACGVQRLAHRFLRADRLDD